VTAASGLRRCELNDLMISSRTATMTTIFVYTHVAKRHNKAV